VSTRPETMRWRGMQWDSPDSLPRLLQALATDETTARERAAQAAQLLTEAHSARQHLDALVAQRQELDAKIAQAEADWREKSAAAEQQQASAEAAAKMASDTRKMIDHLAPGALNGQTPPGTPAVGED
jgi:septal ring factor EnvC (AmiA/AmiB activator)